MLTADVLQDSDAIELSHKTENVSTVRRIWLHVTHKKQQLDYVFDKIGL